MPNVNFRGVDQEYHLLSPQQKEEFYNADRINARGGVSPSGQPAGNDAWIHALPYEEKLKLRSQGARVDFAAPPPAHDSYKLAQTTTQNRAGHVVDTYKGDPRVWMDQFAPPVRFRTLAFRRDRQSEASWQQTRADCLRLYVERNPGRDTSNEASELNLMRAFRSG